jgi:hypothetical protein
MEPIHARRLQDWIAMTRHVWKAVIVGKDDDHIGALGWRAPSVPPSGESRQEISTTGP